MAKPAFNVYQSLAGHSASRRLVKTYVSLPAAKRFCEAWSGFGRVMTIESRSTGQEIASYFSASR